MSISKKQMDEMLQAAYRRIGASPQMVRLVEEKFREFAEMGEYEKRVMRDQLEDFLAGDSP